MDEETAWILSSWLKPADLDLHCFQKRVYNFRISDVNSTLIRLNMVIILVLLLSVFACLGQNFLLVDLQTHLL